MWPDLPDPAAIRYAMAWGPPEGLLASLPNLKAIFSLGAGVDHIVLAEAPAGRADRQDRERPTSPGG